LNQTSSVQTIFFVFEGWKLHPEQKPNAKQSNIQLYITASRFKSEAAEIRKDQRKVLQVPKAWQVGVFRYSENKNK